MSLAHLLRRGARDTPVASPSTCRWYPTSRLQFGVVVREPRLTGQRRRDGAQRAVPAEGRRVEPAAAVTGVGLNSLGGGHRARRAARPLLRLGRPEWCGPASRSRRQQGARRDPGRASRSSVSCPRPAGAGGWSARRCGASSSSPPRAWPPWPARPSGWRQLFGGSVALTLAYIGGAGGGGRRLPRRPLRSPRSARCTSARRSSPPRHRHPAGWVPSRRRSSPGSPASDMEPGAAVAAVLSYRLVTYWLPILPGWISFHELERKGQI